MKVIEVWFHPRTKRSSRAPHVRVARVVCERHMTAVELFDFGAGDVVPFDTDGIRAKLRNMLETAGGDAYATLQRVRSEFWSFVPTADRGPADEAP